MQFASYKSGIPISLALLVLTLVTGCQSGAAPRGSPPPTADPADQISDDASVDTNVEPGTGMDPSGAPDEQDDEPTPPIAEASGEVDLPPIADAGEDHVVTEGGTVVLNGLNSLDPEGQTLLYHWSPPPGSGLILTNPNGPTTVFVAPQVDETTRFDFTLMVSDQTSSATDMVSVTVLDGLAAASAGLIADAGPDEAVVSGALVTLNGGGSSGPDPLAMSFSWAQLSGAPVTMGSPGEPVVTFVAPPVDAPESLVFELTVSDGTESANDEVVITVSPSDSGGAVAPASGGNDDLNLAFACSPIDGQRNLSVTCTVSTLDGSPLPEGLYSWDFDGEVSEGGVQTHSSAEHVFTTGGLHVVTLTLTIAGVASSIECSQTGTTTRPITVWPTVTGMVQDAGGSGIANVTVSATPGGYTAVTNANGQFVLHTPYNWSGLIVPQSSGLTFTPGNQVLASITSDTQAQLFVAAAGAPPVTISGTVQTASGSPVSGVVLAGTNSAGTVTTNASGNYALTVPSGWSGTVTPVLVGFTFNPSSRTYSNVVENQSGQDYVANPATLSISGQVRTAAGAPIPNVLVTASNNGGSALTNSNGNYTLSVTTGWSGTVTPTLSGYTFSPPSLSFANLSANQVNQNFTGTPPPPSNVAISGQVRTAAGAPIPGVLVTASNGGGSATTNASGAYSLNVSSGWSGSVTPSLNGYLFAPPSITFTNVTAPQANQDFTGSVLSGPSISGTVQNYAGSPYSGVPIVFTGSGGSAGVNFVAVSNAGGAYAQTVPNGWSGTATADANFHFEPASRSYSGVSSPITGHNFVAYRNYYVATNGNDGSGGTMTAPFLTVQKGANTAQTGDTVFIRSGTYTVLNVTLANDGLPGKPITISGFPGEPRPFIQRTDTPFSSQSVFVLAGGKHDIVFRDLVVRNAGNGFNMYADTLPRNHDIKIDNVEMTGHNGSGIRTGSYGVERLWVRNCAVHDNWSTEGGFDFKVNILDYSCGAGSRQVLIQDSEFYNHYHNQASGLIAQNSSEDFIYIGNVAYANGEISFASKSGGHNLYINNYGYDQSKAVFYLSDPAKDFGGGNIITGCGASNYLLLNNVGIGRIHLEGDQGPIKKWGDASVWAYNNTLIALKEPVGAFFGAPFSIRFGYQYPTTFYVKNNIACQLAGSARLGVFQFGGNDASTLEYVGENNLFFAAGFTAESNLLFRYHTGTTNFNLAQFQAWIDSEYTSTYGNPMFTSFDPANDTIPQNVHLAPGSAAIGGGTTYSVTDPNDYPTKINDFLAPYGGFTGWTQMTAGERGNLVSFIQTAYLRDHEGTLRNFNTPTCGAYEP